MEMRWREEARSPEMRRRQAGGSSRVWRCAVALGAIAAVLASACGSPKGPAAASPSFDAIPTTSPQAGYGAQTLPKGVLASIPLDAGPLRIGMGFGSVWVAAHRGSSLWRIDPATNKVVATIDVGQESCGTPGAGFGRVWVLGCNPGSQGNLIVVDPTTNQVVGSARFGGLVLGFGAGSVWAPTRIDPKTLRSQARIKADGADVVFGAGSVWVSNESNGTVSRVDPATNRVSATIPAGVAGAGESFEAFADGALWVYPGLEAPVSADRHDDKIWRIDPRNNSVREEPLPHFRGFDPLLGGATFAAGLGSLWLRTGGGRVHRYDARTLRPLGVYPTGTNTDGFVAIGFGSLWATNINDDTVSRVRI